MEPFGVQKRVCGEIDRMKEEMVRTLQELVRTPSVVGQEEEAQQDPWLQQHPPQVEWFGWHADPWYQDPDHPFVLSFRKAAGNVLGREVKIIGRAGGLDSRFSQYFNMAAACTGPRTNNIHGIDEYVEIPSVIQVTQVLAMATLEWCGYKESPLPHSAIESV